MASELDEMIKEFKEIDDIILNWSYDDRKDVHTLRKRLQKVNRNVLRLKLSIEDDTIYGGKSQNVNMNAINILMQNIKTARKFVDSVQLDAQSETLRHLTIITTICMPLSLITGFFGMNFAFMGIDPGTKGMLRSKYSEFMLWALMIGVIVVFQTLFYFRQL